MGTLPPGQLTKGKVTDVRVCKFLLCAFDVLDRETCYVAILLS